MTVELGCKKVYLINGTCSIIIYDSKYARDYPERFTLNIYTTHNLLRINFSFNDIMLKTNRLKKDFFL